ncbi:uncharacterized protein LOC132740750 [Ruditapes philippinarum]|uniref:uncharacterized protein LOC132740750 n=1 Tax=Ruditapes philippinarum TaxID=129788 RepID=UPI00295AFEDA|nr:uncharacterized protein LOC132740750 [Ruditapes philippinarum]
MDVKLVLLFLVLINQMSVGSCCAKKKSGGKSAPRCKVKVILECDVLRKRRAIDSTNMTERELFQRIGTELNIIPVENQCKFETYDRDGDEMIKQEELEAIFGIRKETKDLIAFMDFKDNDGMISKDEFCVAGPHLIKECEGCICVKMNQTDTL